MSPDNNAGNSQDRFREAESDSGECPEGNLNAQCEQKTDNINNSNIKENEDLIKFDNSFAEKDDIATDEVCEVNPVLCLGDFSIVNDNDNEIFDPNVFFDDGIDEYNQNEFHNDVIESEFDTADFFSAINNSGLAADEITSTFKQFDDSDRFIESANLANELGFELTEVADVMGRIDEGTFDYAANLAREFESIDSSEFFEMAGKTDMSTLNNLAAFAGEGESIIEIFDGAVDEAFDSVRAIGNIEVPSIEMVNMPPQPTGIGDFADFGDIGEFEAPPPSDFVAPSSAEFGEIPQEDFGANSPTSDFGDIPEGDFDVGPPPGEIGEIPQGEFDGGPAPGDFGDISEVDFDGGPPQMMDMEFSSDAPPTPADIAAIEKKFGDDAGFGDFDEIVPEGQTVGEGAEFSPDGGSSDGTPPDQGFDESSPETRRDGTPGEEGPDDGSVGDGSLDDGPISDGPDDGPVGDAGAEDASPQDIGVDGGTDGSVNEVRTDGVESESNPENAADDIPTPAADSLPIAEDTTQNEVATSVAPPSISADAAPPPPTPVSPPPPSPVPVEKAPTPVDTADVGDKTLASVSQPKPPKPAQQAQSASVKNVEVVPGSPVNVQVPIPTRPPSGITSSIKIPSVGNSSNW